MAYLSTVGIDTVVVIESLGSDSAATGQDLFETTIAPAVLARNMVGELYQVSTRPEFLGALHRTLALARNGRSPVLQIEAHGDVDGIQLAAGQRVSWLELAPLLAGINQTSRMNLLVVAATCHGWHLTSALRPADRSPVWAVIGPPETARAGDLYDAMKLFYSSLLSGFDVGTAVRRMNRDTTMDQWAYLISTAELFYCQVFRAYMRELDIGPASERANKLVAEIVKYRDLAEGERAQMRAEVLEDISDYKKWFDRYKQHFLMLDLFPENERRFRFSFDDCVRRAA